jgi:tRNA pseudouridine38-40 synthase
MDGRSQPLDRHRALEIDDRLDVAAMRAAADALVGERDFAALGSDVHGRTVRHLVEVAIRRRGSLVEVRVTADAFLRRMARSIVALLLEVGRGRLAPADVVPLLEAGRRILDGRAAPARGLTLEKVMYLNTIKTGKAESLQGRVMNEGRRPGRTPSAQPEQKAGT